MKSSEIILYEGLKDITMDILQLPGRTYAEQAVGEQVRGEVGKVRKRRAGVAG